MTDQEMWALIVGALAPLVIAIIQQPKWAETKRVAVTVGFCIAAGAGTSYFAGNFSGRSLISDILMVLVAALATYRGVWRPSGIAPRIEVATSKKVP
ncbi:MAG TPA: hypothetical protein VIU40_09055 [Geobacteraceae bacterium]